MQEKKYGKMRVQGAFYVPLYPSMSPGPRWRSVSGVAFPSQTRRFGGPAAAFPITRPEQILVQLQNG
nr:MAG TPA: hypothetical protein [Caudoviricetes sp.]